MTHIRYAVQTGPDTFVGQNRYQPGKGRESNRGGKFEFARLFTREQDANGACRIDSTDKVVKVEIKLL